MCAHALSEACHPLPCWHFETHETHELPLQVVLCRAAARNRPGASILRVLSVAALALTPWSALERAPTMQRIPPQGPPPHPTPPQSCHSYKTDPHLKADVLPLPVAVKPKH